MQVMGEIARLSLFQLPIMKKHKNYQEDQIVRQLRKKADINIPADTKYVELLFGSGAKGDIGIKSKGKIDFLRKHCGYTVYWTTRFQNISYANRKSS